MNKVNSPKRLPIEIGVKQELLRIAVTVSW